ncbi:serine/threonine-protein kinase [Nonomuraea muscovyensis]|uniref:non-specific serine/threonine protein kinase n=1 Tax=Nonomuraea muscovyensis TaxID=1124761 RepID=A0A7X0BXG9_9ACTN|nr:serine/threonine-protein kinase [Nonomuraea muscovyensis]MBB6344754.1 serine/threonine-protein kinase [Nonomuraea muscovyensis]
MVPGYHEVRQLGAGRTGRVFLATYEATGAYVAIKYLNATLRRDAAFMERFRSDVRALVELDDPAVVRTYEYVETPERAAVVMECVDGVSLRTLLAEHGRTSPEAALALLKSTLLALAAAHGAGVPHRDVTPGNVLVQADGTVRLGDFGVVVHAEEPGVPAGSPPYMSPELWTGEPAGPAADLYAAACLLFEAVMGRPPYLAADVVSLREKHLSEAVPLEVVPDTLRDLLRRGMAKNTDFRYASAPQFAAELEEDAVAGYGPEWEQRGRRHLAERATALALGFPLARSEQGSAKGTRGRPRGVPKPPPHLWITGAAVAAVMIGILLAGGGSSGPGTVLMPPPTTPGGEEAAPGDATAPARRTPTGSRPSATPARTPPDAAPGTPRGTPPGTPPGTAPGTVTRTAPPVPTGTRRPSRPTSSPGTAVPTPTRSAVARPSVRSADIVRWSGSAGAVRVAADGTGPVRLRITYTRREGDGPARTVAEETRTLTGHDVYTSTVLRDLGDVPCGTRVHFGLVVLTEPVAGNGPQVSEAAVDGAPCPSPSASISPSDLPGPSPGRDGALPSPETWSPPGGPAGPGEGG